MPPRRVMTYLVLLSNSHANIHNFMTEMIVSCIRFLSQKLTFGEHSKGYCLRYLFPLIETGRVS